MEDRNKKEKDRKPNNLSENKERFLTSEEFEKKFHWSPKKEDIVEYYSEKREEFLDIKNYNPKNGKITLWVIPDFKKKQGADGVNNVDINSFIREKIKVRFLTIKEFEKLISSHNFQYIENWKKEETKNKLTKKTMEKIEDKSFNKAISENYQRINNPLAGEDDFDEESGTEEGKKDNLNNEIKEDPSEIEKESHGASDENKNPSEEIIEKVGKEQGDEKEKKADVENKNEVDKGEVIESSDLEREGTDVEKGKKENKIDDLIDLEELLENMKKSESNTEKPANGAEENQEMKWSPELLSLSNQGIWAKMSEGGKKFFSDICDSIKSKMPEPTRFLGKIGVAFNQFWINKHEQRAVELKGEMNKIEMQRKGLNKAKDEISKVIEKLKNQGIPGSESLQVKIKKLEQRDIKLLEQKDKIQSKFEDRDNKSALYTNNRDRIANSFISRYDQKLFSVESELQGLRKELVEVSSSGGERLKNWQDQISGWEKQREAIRAAYKLSGETDRQIRKDSAVKTLDQLIMSSQKEKAKLEKMISDKKNLINKELARLDKNANPYRDKREAFVRATGLRPVRAEVDSRTRGEAFSQEEVIKSNPREKRAEENERSENSNESTTENSAEKENSFKASFFIESFNKQLEQKAKKKLEFIINEKDFLKINKIGKDTKINLKKFKGMLNLYYEKKKLDLNDVLKKSNDSK